MGFKIYGIAAAQSKDRDGETLLIDGLNTDNLTYLNDEHDDSLGRVIGAVTKHRKIFTEQDCEDDKQRRCWQVAQVPLLYVEGELATDEEHPDAQSAAALIKFTNRMQNSPLKIGLSIEGGTIERGGEDEKQLVRTLGLGASLTVKPANPICVLYPEVNLTKSAAPIDPPARYWQALKKVEQKKSFIDLPHAAIHAKLVELKKSLDNYWGAFTYVKCRNCGKPTRFFKSSSDVPNGCPHCFII